MQLHINCQILLYGKYYELHITYTEISKIQILLCCLVSQEGKTLSEIATDNENDEMKEVLNEYEKTLQPDKDETNTQNNGKEAKKKDNKCLIS